MNIIDACTEGNINIERVKELIASGANLDEQNLYSGQTALHAACTHYSRPIHIVKLLIEAGANVNIRRNSGLTPLGLIISCYHIDNELREIVEYLKENGAIE